MTLFATLACLSFTGKRYSLYHSISITLLILIIINTHINISITLSIAGFHNHSLRWCHCIEVTVCEAWQWCVHAWEGRGSCCPLPKLAEHTKCNCMCLDTRSMSVLHMLLARHDVKICFAKASVCKIFHEVSDRRSSISSSMRSISPGYSMATCLHSLYENTYAVLSAWLYAVLRIQSATRFVSVGACGTTAESFSWTGRSYTFVQSCPWQMMATTGMLQASNRCMTITIMTLAC